MKRSSATTKGSSPCLPTISATCSELGTGTHSVMFTLFFRGSLSHAGFSSRSSRVRSSASCRALWSSRASTPWLLPLPFLSSSGNKELGISGRRRGVVVIFSAALLDQQHRTKERKKGGDWRGREEEALERKAPGAQKKKKISALSPSLVLAVKRERSSANPSSWSYPPRTRIPKVLGVVAVPAVVLIPPKVPLPALSSFPVFSLSFCCRHSSSGTKLEGGDMFAWRHRPGGEWEGGGANLQKRQRIGGKVCDEPLLLFCMNGPDWGGLVGAERRGVSFALNGQIGATEHDAILKICIDTNNWILAVCDLHNLIWFDRAGGREGERVGQPRPPLLSRQNHSTDSVRTVVFVMRSLCIFINI